MPINERFTIEPIDPDNDGLPQMKGFAGDLPNATGAARALCEHTGHPTAMIVDTRDKRTWIFHASRLEEQDA